MEFYQFIPFNNILKGEGGSTVSTE